MRVLLTFAALLAYIIWQSSEKKSFALNKQKCGDWDVSSREIIWIVLQSQACSSSWTTSVLVSTPFTQLKNNYSSRFAPSIKSLTGNLFLTLEHETYPDRCCQWAWTADRGNWPINQRTPDWRWSDWSEIASWCFSSRQSPPRCCRAVRRWISEHRPRWKGCIKN